MRRRQPDPFHLLLSISISPAIPLSDAISANREKRYWYGKQIAHIRSPNDPKAGHLAGGIRHRLHRGPSAPVERAGPRQVKKPLAALAWIIIVLISNCLPSMLAACAFAAILILSGAIGQGPFPGRIRQLSFCWCLCLGVVAIGMAKTKLGARIAYTLMSSIGRTPSAAAVHYDHRLYHLRPDRQSARAAGRLPHHHFCPPCNGRKPGESKIGSAMFIGLIWAGGTGGIAFISSAATNVGRRRHRLRIRGAVTVDFTQFSIIGIPVGLALTFAGWIVLSCGSSWARVQKSCPGRS